MGVRLRPTESDTVSCIWTTGFVIQGDVLFQRCFSCQKYTNFLELDFLQLDFLELDFLELDFLELDFLELDYQLSVLRPSLT
ncbi:hypothetical protein NPIL_219611 [Nephila pilipes]|uniref:Uncharacterized protein n=1 Tax=Nephila pilipes TaxID=299642 RepID=A0A8X6N2A3_NEPPI|nr:hypothetical protein NPIL_219611 [Nephila pilipes]